MGLETNLILTWRAYSSYIYLASESMAKEDRLPTGALLDGGGVDGADFKRTKNI